MPGSKLGHFVSVTSDSGRPIPAWITVYDAGTSNLSTIFLDAGGVFPLANPCPTDAIGRLKFYAAVGNYEAEVSGPGITTYRIDINLSNITLISELMDVTTYFAITPEEYGAKGNANDDDWASFNAMFNAMALMPAAKRKKIVLNPDSHYIIGSRKNSTNVFEIALDNLIFEGKGKESLCLQYEGPAATNLFQFATNAKAVSVRDAYIRGDNLTPGHGGVGAKITNILNVDNMIGGSILRSSFAEFAGTVLEGDHWNMIWDQVDARDGAVGFKMGTTTTTVENCYANGCTKGYNIGGSYGVLVGCSCDWADYAYYLDGAAMVALAGCGSEACKQGIYGYATQISVQGFMSYNKQYTVGQVPAAFVELTNTKGKLSGVLFADNLIANAYYYKLTNCPNLVLTDDYVPRERVYQTTDNTETNFALPVRVGNDFFGSNNIGKSANDIVTLITDMVSNSNLCQQYFLILMTGAASAIVSLLLQNIRGAGSLSIQKAWDGLGSAKITFSQAAGDALVLNGIAVPLAFRGFSTTDIFHLKQTGTGALVKIAACQRVKFFYCKLETTLGTGAIFDLSDDSLLELDKNTMDNITGTFASLLTSGNDPRRVRFSGYSDKPTLGIFDTGCIIYFDAPTAGGHPGCVCTAGGVNAGTWKYLAAIEA